jgi:hypothetical protein
MTLQHLVLAAVLMAALTGTHAMAVEEPAFKTVLHEGAFEIRDYPPLVVAEVTITGDQKEAASQGFRLLAGYIFGGNTRRQSIAMTAPVAQTQTSEKIAMTAPVTQIKAANAWVVRFTMPKGYSLETLPQPDNPKVQLRALPASRFAVLQFSGLAGTEDVSAKTAELQNRIAKHKLRPTSPVSLAQYNPPWTLWFMRRNEVMVEVAR